MKNKKSNDKLSISELFLMILVLAFYVLTLYFLITDNRSYTIVTFSVHSCILIVYLLIFHNKVIRNSLQQNAGGLETLRNEFSIISKYEDERLVLKQERDNLLSENEQLKAQTESDLLRINTLTSELADAGQQPDNSEAPSNMIRLFPPDEKPVKLNIIDCANKVIEEMQPYSSKAGIQVLLSSASEALNVRADANYIRIMFRNIVDNSIKYMNRSGSLIITISNIGDDLFIVLKDNGEGLSKHETSRIFELNYQGTNRISGNGLGLTQAKAIVEYYGGTIYAKSDAGKGMGIYIQLPANCQ